MLLGDLPEEISAGDGSEGEAVRGAGEALFERVQQAHEKVTGFESGRGVELDSAVLRSKPDPQS